MAVEKDNPLLKESYDFISKNLEIYSDKIPRHLRDFWMEDDEVEDEIDSNSFTVFMYALVRYKKETTKEFSLSEEELLVKYQTWQTFLSLSQISEFTDVKTAPVKLFDFDNYDKMQLEFI